MNEIKEISESLNIPIIANDRRYWLVRTDSGKLWEQFISEEFVAINWNEFSDINILNECKNNKEKELELKLEIQNKYKVEQGGRILNQISRFVFDMKIGDIVMIPSENSDIISFGEIISDIYSYEVTDEDIDNERCDFIKRKNIKWLKSVNKGKLDPLLFKMLQAHQAISNADNYAHEIDRTLELLYVKDDKCYLTLMVTATGDIKGKDLYALQKLVYDSLDIDSDSLSIKINVQSPGPIEFITEHIWDVIKILFALNIIIGGGKCLGFEMPGILHWYHTIMKLKNEQKLEEEKLKLERDKFDFEKEQREITNMTENYQQQIERLDLRIPENLEHIINQLNRLNDNSEMLVDNDELEE